MSPPPVGADDLGSEIKEQSEIDADSVLGDVDDQSRIFEKSTTGDDTQFRFPEAYVFRPAKNSVVDHSIGMLTLMESVSQQSITEDDLTESLETFKTNGIQVVNGQFVINASLFRSIVGASNHPHLQDQ